MEGNGPVDSTEKFERAFNKSRKARYVLRLYIAGNSTKSALAIANIREICENNLKGRYNLEVIDIYQQPELARGDQVVAAPTLIKSMPLPLRRVIGDLSSTDRVLVKLDLIPLDDQPANHQNDGDEKK